MIIYNKFKLKSMKKYVPIWRYFCFIVAMTMLLGGLVPFFTSCSTEDIDEKTDPLTTITGKDGNLNFALDFVDYGESEDVSLHSAADMTAETVVVPLSDNLSMYATLEPVR